MSQVKTSEIKTIPLAAGDGEWYEIKLRTFFDEGFARDSRRDAMKIAIHKARLLVAKWMNRPVLPCDAFPRTRLRRFQTEIGRYQSQFAQRTTFLAELAKEMARPAMTQKEKEYAKLYEQQDKYLKEIESGLVKLKEFAQSYAEWIRHVRELCATLAGPSYVDFLVDVLEPNSHTAKYGTSADESKVPKISEIRMDVNHIIACHVEEAIPILINFAHHTMETVLGPTSFDRFPDPKWFDGGLQLRADDILPLELDSFSPDNYYPYGVNALNQIQRCYAPDILFQMIQDVPRQSETKAEASAGKDIGAKRPLVFNHLPNSAYKAEANVATIPREMKASKSLSRPLTKASASPFLPSTIGPHMPAVATKLRSPFTVSNSSAISHLPPSQYIIPHL